MARKDKLPSHGADKYPRTLGQFAIVKVDRNLAGILLEGKMISEVHVKLFLATPSVNRPRNSMTSVQGAISVKKFLPMAVDLSTPASRDS
jgi:hypothetical protein